MHYTHAINLDEKNYTLYSNRSYAFLKVQQYYLALEDANETIKLNPNWPKGYFRRAEVEFATGHYMEACSSYKQALELKPDDLDLVEALNRTAKEILKEKKNDETIPWLGAGIGIIVGVVLVIADCVLANSPTHPMIMAFVTIIIAMIGYAIARSYRYYVKCQKKGLIQPPLDFENKKENADQTETDSKSGRDHPRYTRSQARQRYKKGKM